MPSSCLVVGCSNHKKKNPGLCFCRVPNIVTNQGEETQILSTERRTQWLAAISRADLTEKILENDRVCGIHFHSGKAAQLWDRLNPGWVPRLYLGHGNCKLKESDERKEQQQQERAQRITKRRKREREREEQEAMQRKVIKVNEPGERIRATELDSVLEKLTDSIDFSSSLFSFLADAQLIFVTLAYSTCFTAEVGVEKQLSELKVDKAYGLDGIPPWFLKENAYEISQVKCTWLLPTAVKEVPYAPIADIDFRSAKKLKRKFDETINNLTTTKRSTGSHSGELAKVAASVPGETEPMNFYAEVNSCKTNAAALSLIYPFSGAFVSKSRNVPTISDLFDKKYLDFEYHDLLKACEKTSPKITDEELRLTEEDTRSQSKGSSLYCHRAGRIGASNTKAACHTNPAQSSQSLIKTICYPNIFTFSTEAAEHGCNRESAGIETYERIKDTDLEQYINKYNSCLNSGNGDASLKRTCLPISKYSLLETFTVTLLFVVFMSKLISSVKESCLISATGTLFFPKLITSGDAVRHQKFWEGGGSPYSRMDGRKFANLPQQDYRMPKSQHVDDKLPTFTEFSQGNGNPTQGDPGEREVKRKGERAWPFDVENGAFDLRNLRPTDFPFNKRVCLPAALEDDKEVDMQHLKWKLRRVTEEYIEGQGRRVARGNLTHEEQRGLRSLRSKETATVVFQTDKSGRFAVDNADNYRAACQPHVENDHTVTEELHGRVQAEANAHSVVWVRLLNTDKLQSKGGPIGSQLTSVPAQLFMVWWDRLFKMRMDDNGLRLRMYKRYVDDINVIVNTPRAGLSKELPWETTVGHVNHMMLRLQYSGYDQKFRTEVVRSALKAYNRIIELNASGEQPLYGPREWKRLERDQERRGKRESGYRKGGFDTMTFVPATPGSLLKN
ncbi:hypothetical protein AWC38_SpisGene13073 [Stylophora pistillata]|uniref:THAP-type domain-containing protein n=1 Tax=Stylophora pistillata TaxID=50429 RepID=A0A2B4RVC7_STYPI|nr:hypothetical protein AWC38_SpisGene13073 [Stylophora pistillata]